MKHIKIILLFALIAILPAHTARALDYNLCGSADDSAACKIAYLKIKTLPNPLDKNKTYFDDGIHIINGKLFMFPDIHVALTDLDGDGRNELIARIDDSAEEGKGLFCKYAANDTPLCPNYIIQDRNLPEAKRSLRAFKAFGPIFSTGIGLSTDERVSGFTSLRAYQDVGYKQFNVMQYDLKSDKYFDISRPPAP